VGVLDFQNWARDEAVPIWLESTVGQASSFHFSIPKREKPA
jgi:hypothetical protein